MKKKPHLSVLMLIALFSLAFGFTSCELSESPVEEASPTVAAAANPWGSCTGCPLSAVFNGPLALSNHGGLFLSHLNDCYAESLSDLGNNCEFVLGGGEITQSIAVGSVIYYPFDVSEYCGYFQLVGSEILASRPGNNWMLSSIDSMGLSHGGSFIYRFAVTWKRYICQAVSIRK